MPGQYIMSKEEKIKTNEVGFFIPPTSAFKVLLFVYIFYIFVVYIFILFDGITICFSNLVKYIYFLPKVFNFLCIYNLEKLYFSPVKPGVSITERG